MIDCNVGESECLGLRHAAVRYFRYDINKFAANLMDGLLTSKHGTEVNIHIVLHQVESTFVGSYLQYWAKVQLLDAILQEMSKGGFSEDEESAFWDDFDNL